MPDLSLFMPLCTLLDITLNELFAGEYIAEEKLKEKADEVLMNVITNWLGHDNREKGHFRESKENDTAPQNVLEVENISKLYKNVSTGHENILEKHKIENNSVLAVNDVSFQNIVHIPNEATAEFRRRHLEIDIVVQNWEN